MLEKKMYRWEFNILSLVVYTTFFIVPVILGFALSFTTWNAMGELGKEYIRFNGFANYINIFTNHSYDLWAVLGRTILYGTVTTIGKNVIGFALALLCYRNLKTSTILRAIFFLPAMLAPIAVGMIFNSFFVTEGVINNILISMGLGQFTSAWLQDNWFIALCITMLVDIWRQAGFNMVIYIAGLMLIDHTYFEASAIDGASYFKQLFYIILPHMLAAFSINLILNLSAGLKAFDIIQVMTAGGPVGKTELLATKMYRLYGQKDYGISCAFGTIMFILTSIFGCLSMKLTQEKS